jgi:hypothetical protein
MPPEPGGPSCRHCGKWITECQPDCAHEGWYHALTRNHYCADGEHVAERAEGENDGG